MIVDIEMTPTELPAGYFGRIYQAGASGLEGEHKRYLPTGGYEITPVDAIYLSISANFENAGEPGRTIWCMLRRFVALYCRGHISSLKRMIETFSQPVNPAWAWIEEYAQGATSSQGIVLNRGNEDLAIPGEPTSGGRANALRARRIYLDPENLALPERDQDGRGARVSRQQARQANIRRLQAIYQGGSEGRRQWNALRPSTREAVYTILRGGSGPPAGFVEGFDDFGSYGIGTDRYDLFRQSTERQLELLGNEAFLTEVVNRRRRDSATRGQRGIRFYAGGEWYIYKSFGPNHQYGTAPSGRVYIIGPDGNSHPEGISGTGRLFAASTEERTAHRGVSAPGSVSSTSGGSGYSQTASTESTNFDTWNVLDQDSILENERTWAEGVKDELSRVYRGRRIIV